ncbi:MAG TPA: outer membrane lipoprotein carrier protein LolA [Glaciecola sp.]|nr:outer membrane lipoprotein carrier protein LolA [Glaciecola sp.]
MYPLSQHKHAPRLGMALCLLLFTSSTLAEVINDKPALRGLLAKINTLQASFTQVVNDSEGQPLQSSSGNLILQQPDRVYWQVLVPDETLLIANGERVFYVDEFVEQVSIFSQKDMISNNPLMLLTSSDDEVWEQFSVVQQNLAYVVTPINNEGQITQLTLRFIQDELTQFTLLDNQGQVSQFTLNGTVLNMPLPINQFSYAIPEGFSVDDQTQ